MSKHFYKEMNLQAETENINCVISREELSYRIPKWATYLVFYSPKESVQI